MYFTISKPSLELSPYIKNYWAMDYKMGPGKHHVQRIVPHGFIELTFYLEDKPSSLSGDKLLSESTLITGQLKDYFDISLHGNVSLFSILFLPHGLSAFFDLPVSEFFNRAVPLKFLLKEETRELEEKLYKAAKISEKVKITEEFLLNRLKKNKTKYDYGRLNQSINQINIAKGCVSIESLASEACLSRKQYERKFLDYVGTTPKKFLKTVRFQNAIHERSIHAKVNLTTLAYKCGYYDQSHMTSEFHQLAGMSPKQYFADCEPYSDYFQ